MIERSLINLITASLKQGRAIILIGARRTGKTTLLKQLTGNMQKVLWFNGDEITTRTLFENITTEKFKTLFEDNRVIVIDEAQRIENIGLKLKLVIDNIPEIQVIASGSSALELANKINEPLTGRKWEYQLFPLSFGEMAAHHGLFEEMKHLQLRMIYGYFPEVVSNPGNEKKVLHELTESYLYKDILVWERIKKPDKLVRLVQALAFQIGNEVSFNELSNLIEIDKITIEKYILLLEQMQVIFRLNSFSRNLRNELKAAKKIYFYDNGIRNALISNFQPLELRNDTGALWENFLISERTKYLHYHEKLVNRWFWRTTAQQEIDYLEEHDGLLFGYEIKWNPRKKVKFPLTFTRAYPETTNTLINQENFTSFLV
ncbi:MAG: ATP-binding protein [Bacteroidales bacterium]|nr:ATP-binding protein [Bacteroidales bacterium]